MFGSVRPSSKGAGPQAVPIGGFGRLEKAESTDLFAGAATDVAIIDHTGPQGGSLVR